MTAINMQDSFNRGHGPATCGFAGGAMIPLKDSISDGVPLRGEVEITAWRTPKAPVTAAEREAAINAGLFAGTHVCEKNLIVNVARRVMSRLLAGCVGPDNATIVTTAGEVDVTGNPEYLFVTKMRWGTGGLQPTVVPGIGNLIYQHHVDSSDDFPTAAEVTAGWCYYCLADVTDNDVTKTNTGQSFVAGDYFYWDGAAWVTYAPSNQPNNPLLNDENLYAPLPDPLFKAVTVDYPTDRSVRFTAGLDQDEANGFEITEEGLFTEGDGATDWIVAHKCFRILTKDIQFSFVFAHTIIF